MLWLELAHAFERPKRMQTMQRRLKAIRISDVLATLDQQPLRRVSLPAIRMAEHFYQVSSTPFLPLVPVFMHDAPDTAVVVAFVEFAFGDLLGVGIRRFGLVQHRVLIHRKGVYVAVDGTRR